MPANLDCIKTLAHELPVVAHCGDDGAVIAAERSLKLAGLPGPRVGVVTSSTCPAAGTSNIGATPEEFSSSRCACQSSAESSSEQRLVRAYRHAPVGSTS